MKWTYNDTDNMGKAGMRMRTQSERTSLQAMKIKGKKQRWKKPAGLVLGLLAALAFGCFSSLAAYDSASLDTCVIDRSGRVVITGTAERGSDETAGQNMTGIPAADASVGSLIQEQPSGILRPLTPEETRMDLTLSAEGVAPPVVAEPSDDGYYYLFELKPYEQGIGTRTDYAAWSDKKELLRFELPYTGNEEDARLYSRFVVALKIGDQYRAISNPIYITNPEVMASYTADYPNAQSKKGLLIELDMIQDAMKLGVKHTTINIPYHHLIGGNLEYRYNGKTYYFNEALVEQYDRAIRTFSSKSIVVTAILLNGWNDAHPELHEAGLAKSQTANYYGFNVSTEAGFETTRALMSFLAERYSGADYDHGRVSNWIIGNEVNNNQDWNYVGPKDLASYTKQYEQSFRVAYTAIRSQSRNARVFFSTDYEWKKDNTDLKYAARDFIDRFAEGIRAEGDIDWGLAYHPYPYPMTEPEFWDDDQTGMVNQTADSPVINFKNLSVLTDYFQRPELRSPSGAVRHIILSEEGFTAMSATRGPVFDIQAAAYAYAYYLVDANPYIDAFILNRQVDAISEYNASCAFGLWTVDMSRPDKVIPVFNRPLHTVFRYIDTSRSLRYTEFAKEIIGIDCWSDVIPGFRLER